MSRWDGVRDFQGRFWSKVDQSGDCWIWTGTLRKGYGQISNREGLPLRAHTVAKILDTREDNPPGMVIDHLCRNRACVKPAHLQWVPQAENARRGWEGRKRKAHCPTCRCHSDH